MIVIFKRGQYKYGAIMMRLPSLPLAILDRPKAKKMRLLIELTIEHLVNRGSCQGKVRNCKWATFRFYLIYHILGTCVMFPFQSHPHALHLSTWDGGRAFRVPL